MTKPPDYHHNDIVGALIEGEKSGISNRSIEKIRQSVRCEHVRDQLNQSIGEINNEQ